MTAAAPLQLALGDQPAVDSPDDTYLARKTDWVVVILDATAGHRLPDDVLNRLATACMQHADRERQEA